MTDSTVQSPDSGARRSPIRWVLGLFTSVRFGIFLMIVLFVYSSIGSAGILYPTPDGWRHDMIRQYRAFELTEFEWFHTWFFDINIALMCLNIACVTIFKIPFNIMKLGVWMIHTGIIVLCIGSVIYFGTKIEGDTPVLRRYVSITVDGVEAPRLPALEGASSAVDTPSGTYTFRTDSIDPTWPLLSGEDEGKRAFSVNVSVTPPSGRPYIRQLLDGYPQYTEDIVPGQGRARNIASIGTPIINDSIEMALTPGMQDEFWLRDTFALYIREEGTREWHMRPLDNLPRYNDYIASYADLATGPVNHTLPIDPLDIVVPPANEADPLPEIPLRITGYLRYAVMRPVYTDGGAVTNPVAKMRFRLMNGAVRTRDLVAFDPTRDSAFDGTVAFSWIRDLSELDAYRTPSSAKLSLRVDATGERLEIPLTPAIVGADAFTPVADSGFSYRVAEIVRDLPMPNSTTGSVSLAVVEFETPEGTRFSRWVFPDASMNRDIHEGADAHSGGLDARLSAQYTPSAGGAPIRILAGPGDVGTHVVIDNTQIGLGGEPVRIAPLSPGEPFTMPAGLTIIVDDIIENAREKLQPLIIPKEQRDKNTETALLRAMVQVEITDGDLSGRTWIPFHGYSIEGPEYAVMNSGRYNPTPFVLLDGRRFELLFSRIRRDLPNPVQLDEFIVTTHIGGFSPRDTRSIRDWTSEVSFIEDGEAIHSQSVSTNDPAAHAGYWYFQRTWDPEGQRFTGLGVGNRIGVYTQLVGCCIAVIGMIYAFYVKPIIRRKRQQRVYDSIAPKSGAQVEVAT